MKVLKARLYDLKMKEQQAKLEQIGGEKKDIAFGSQIRSYVLHPYQMVKDHRTKEQVGDVNRVLDGDIDVFIKAYLMKKASGTLGEADGRRRRRLTTGGRPPERADRRRSSSPPASCCSRLAGLVRQRVFAHYFGLAVRRGRRVQRGFRIPNFLQNLFGEGALSASFIPVYAALVARGERREADRVAGAVGVAAGAGRGGRRARRRARDAAAHRRDRAGIHRRRSAS